MASTGRPPSSRDPAGRAREWVELGRFQWRRLNRAVAGLQLCGTTRRRTATRFHTHTTHVSPHYGDASRTVTLSHEGQGWERNGAIAGAAPREQQGCECGMAHRVMETTTRSLFPGVGFPLLRTLRHGRRGGEGEQACMGLAAGTRRSRRAPLRWASRGGGPTHLRRRSRRGVVVAEKHTQMAGDRSGREGGKNSAAPNTSRRPAARPLTPRRPTTHRPSP